MSKTVSSRSFKNPGKSWKPSSAITSRSNPTAIAESKPGNSLAISFSSPNLATNISFSSSSDSDFDQNQLEEGAVSVSKTASFLEVEDASSIDDNDAVDEEAISGENDVEYVELTQRMIPPSESTQSAAQKARDTEMDFILSLSLFDQESSSSSPSNSSGINEANNGNLASKNSQDFVASLLQEMAEPLPKDISSIFMNNFNNLDTGRAGTLEAVGGGIEREFFY